MPSTSDEEKNDKMSRRLLAQVKGMNEGFTVTTAATDQQTDTGEVNDPTRNKFVILDMQIGAPEALFPGCHRGLSQRLAGVFKQ
jgi:hypothetical protein